MTPPTNTIPCGQDTTGYGPYDPCLFRLYVNKPELGDGEGGEDVALDVGLDEDVAVAFVPAGDPGHIVDYELLGLLVKGDAGLDILLGAGLFQQPVDLRVM